MQQIITRGPTLQKIEGWGARALAVFCAKSKTTNQSKCRPATRLEAEHDSRLYAEIALIVVAARERIAEAR
jgi:hypothetical protein